MSRNSGRPRRVPCTRSHGDPPGASARLCIAAGRAGAPRVDNGPRAPAVPRSRNPEQIRNRTAREGPGRRRQSSPEAGRYCERASPRLHSQAQTSFLHGRWPEPLFRSAATIHLILAQENMVGFPSFSAKRNRFRDSGKPHATPTPSGQPIRRHGRIPRQSRTPRRGRFILGRRNPLTNLPYC